MNEKEHKIKGWQRILLLIIPYFIVVGVFQLIGALISGADITNTESKETSIQLLTIVFLIYLELFLF